MRWIARLPMPPALLLACCLQASAAVPPGDAFERTTPAEAGYSEARLEALRDFLSRSGSDSLLLLHHAIGKHVMLTRATVDDYKQGPEAEPDRDEPEMEFESEDLSDDEDDASEPADDPDDQSAD